MKLYSNTLPQGAPSSCTMGILLETSLKNNSLIHGQAFSPTCWHSHGNQSYPIICQSLDGLSKRNLVGNLYLGNPLLEEIHRQYLLNLSGTTKQLHSMKDFMNILHPTIKFTFEHSSQEISFLDTKTYIGADGKLSTILYRKPTDCATLLHFHSVHSLKYKESIALSQALRYNFLIADNTLLQKELCSLTVSLLARKYSLEITYNISKTFLQSCNTPLHRPLRASFQLRPHTHQNEDTSPSQC